MKASAAKLRRLLAELEKEVDAVVANEKEWYKEVDIEYFEVAPHLLHSLLSSVGHWVKMGWATDDEEQDGAEHGA